MARGRVNPEIKAALEKSSTYQQEPVTADTTDEELAAMAERYALALEKNGLKADRAEILKNMTHTRDWRRRRCQALQAKQEDPYREYGPNDIEYYFGEHRGKLMKAMRPQELWARLADMYQLAGGLLIGADVKEARYDGKPARNANGWTDDEVDYAIEVILNFLSCPAEVTKYQIDKANKPYRADEETKLPPKSELPE